MLKYEIGDAIDFMLFDGEFNRFHSGIIINTSTEDGGKYFVMVENNPANRDSLEFVFKTMWITEKDIVNKQTHYYNIDRDVLESWFPKRPVFRMMTVGYCNCNNETAASKKEEKMIKDSGNRTEFKSGAVRDIQEGKGRCDLLPLVEVGEWVEPEHPLNIFTMVNEYRKSPSVNRMRLILDTFAEEHWHGEADLEALKKYRYELVLEVSKHFEEGAKKYGDRNWEKGIPCDRYIDSAIRHYLKWRAGWTDEPHDRAFMWNILCCEWTRMEYGWNLERLEKKGENDTAIREFIDKIGNGGFAEKAHRLGDSVIPMLSPLLDYNRQDESESKKFAQIGEQLAKGVQESMESVKEQEIANLKEACAIIEHEKACFESSPKDCWNKNCDECEHYIDPDITHKAINQLLDHAKKSLKERENVVNRYIRNVTGGVELYDDAGQYVGYVHGFSGSKESEVIIRSLVESSWGLLTFNAYTLEKIIEDHGYIADVHFIVEMYKDYSDIKLPKQWHVIKSKSTEEKK